MELWDSVRQHHHSHVRVAPLATRRVCAVSLVRDDRVPLRAGLASVRFVASAHCNISIIE
jgi:hypothetical protein